VLAVRGKRVLLSIHIALNAVWIGAIAIILFLLLGKDDVPNGDQLSALHSTIFTIHDTVVMNVALLSAVTGILFSLFTNWGFFRFRWIIVKWASVSALCLLMTLNIAPALNGMAAMTDVERNEALVNPLYRQYESESIIFLFLELAGLISIIPVSVFKPWGQRTTSFHVERRKFLIGWSIVGGLLIVGAYIQQTNLEAYRNLVAEQFDLSKSVDGKYIGEAEYGFRYVVRVTIDRHSIKDIEFLENRSTIYAKLAEGVAKKVIRDQNLQMAAVTGATTTSKCLTKAIENAVARSLAL